MQSSTSLKNNGNGYPLNYQISTENSFETLMNGSNNKNCNEFGIPKNSKPNKPLPPFITKLKSNDVRQIMKSLKISKFEMKLTSLGLKVTTFNSSQYNQFSEELKKIDAEFFSYTLDENKTSRFVLFGLPSLPIEEVESFIIETGLKPTNITKVIPKKVRSNDGAMYFMSFPSSITYAHLRNHRYIGNIVCRWDVPHKKPERLTQCTKCQLFGHTTNNCNMKSKCKYCSLNHIDEQECIIKDLPTNHKCGNCDGNHTSNSITCPKRQEYLNIRDLLNQKKSVRTPQINNLRNFNFPRLANQISDISPNTTTLDGPSQRPYSEVLKDNTIPLNYVHVDQHNAERLYSSNELLIILESVMDGLRKCRSPADQVQVILAAAIKYVCT